MTKILFARPHFATKEQVAQEKIALQTNQDLNYYKDYYPFFSNCSLKQNELKPEPQRGAEKYTENLVRARRCISFSEATKLKPISKEKNILCLLHLETLHSISNLDHTTIWESPSGNTFVLTEPYTKLEVYPNALKENGYLRIEIPISISPYCGNWSSQNNALPFTRSYLISSLSDKEELLFIWRCAEAASKELPAWNDQTGISYV